MVLCVFHPLAWKWVLLRTATGGRSACLSAIFAIPVNGVKHAVGQLYFLYRQEVKDKSKLRCISVLRRPVTMTTHIT